MLDAACRSTSTVPRDEFMDATLDMWEIPPESARRVGHPAPFPVALPERLINLYTYEGDLVLDPFMGSGTTAVAAVRTGRHFVGYDTDPELRRRSDRPGRRRAAGDGRHRRSPAPQVPSEPVDGEDVLERARREGHGAKELTRDLLELAGFGSVEPAPKVAGIEMTFAVRDVDGRRLLIDLLWGVHLVAPRAQAPRHAVEGARPCVLGAAARRRRTDRGRAGQHRRARPSQHARQGARRGGTVPAGRCSRCVELDHAGLEVLGQLAKGLRPGDPGWSGSGWSAR